MTDNFLIYFIKLLSHISYAYDLSMNKCILSQLRFKIIEDFSSEPGI